LIKEFENEEQYIVWLEINNRLATLLNVWYEQPEPIYKGLLKFQRQLVSNLVTRLGWEYSDNDTYLTTMLRTLVIRMAGRADDEDTVREAFRRFNKFTRQNDESAIHPNLRAVVFEIVLSHGGSYEEFDSILKIYHEARTIDQKMIALTGLGYTGHDALIQRALKFSISDEVRNQDIIYAFFGLQSNRKSRRQLWNFIKENWYLIHDRYARSIVLFENIIKLSIELLSSEEDIKDIEKFFANKNCRDFEKAQQQSVESVRANAAWLKRDSKDVENWLRANGYLTEKLK
jgi:aminopeptidase 2